MTSQTSTYSTTHKALLLTGLLFCSLSIIGPARAENSSANHSATDIDSILVGQHRAEKNRARDTYRHPKETLAFLGITPSMTVVEIWPGGGGWYTEVLAPYLRHHGKLYGAHFSNDSPIGFYKRSLNKFKTKISAYPDVYDKMELTVLEPPTHTVIAPPGSADAVLTFRNVHNWVKAGTEKAVFAAMYQALKPGGILGVVEHRGSAGMSTKRMSMSGYVPEEYTVKLAEDAGFELVAKSDINANPKDVKAYPEGVWTLPPSLRLKDKDRAKYLAIGESDRMTLKFIKPLKK